MVEGSGVSIYKFLNPLKIKKVNIGSPENPNFANIGIVADLGEMKIPLKLDARPVK